MRPDTIGTVYVFIRNRTQAGRNTPSRGMNYLFTVISDRNQLQLIMDKVSPNRDVLNLLEINYLPKKK